MLSAKLPLNLCAYHCSILKLFCIFNNVYNMQCLFLENSIQKFTVIDSVQRQNTVYTFQLKSFKHNVILLQVFPRKSDS